MDREGPMLCAALITQNLSMGEDGFPTKRSVILNHRTLTGGPMHGADDALFTEDGAGVHQFQ